ncbi:MAG TPA: hypothetical protein VGM41_19770 [Chitinophagaceae bacterium]|jgi:hypothetical protein
MEVVFEYLFKESNWSPVEYQGKQVSISDTINFSPGKMKFTITFEKINSDWEQGIILKGKGVFFVNNQHIPKSICLWQKNSPKVVEFIFESKDGVLTIWNMWCIEKGPMQYGHNGAALYYEKISNGKRYYCNDGYPDDDFDDLIFTIEMHNTS